MLDRPAIAQRAISIRQPWAWSIIHAGKGVENRSANAARQFRTAIGERVFIHAAKRMTADEYAFAAEFMVKIGVTPPARDELQFGSIIGSVFVAGVVTEHVSPWFQGPTALVLADARPEKLTPMRGSLGLFRVG